MQSKVLANPLIQVMWNTEVQEVIGSQKLEKLILKNTQDGKISEFPTDGLFVAIGHSPVTKIFAGQIDLDEKGYIKKVPANSFATSTSIKGVFVAGDVHDFHYQQAVSAAGFGCMAALDALTYLG